MKCIRLLALAAVLLVAACVPPAMSAGMSAPAGLTIEKVEEAYGEAKAFAELLLPYLPADRVIQIAAIERKIEAAIAAAKAARIIAERIHALQEARTAIVELEGD
jgi:hypothetical protein